MICREIQLADQPPQWWLISQVEHARISGVLAEHCLSHFDKPLRDELLAAVYHHDDGWANWETAPQLDEQGRPYSFRELPLKVSLPIWTASIEAAAEFGPLARATVAGHFLHLLNATDKELPPQSETWRQEMESRRECWISDWQATKPNTHTQELADQALVWLQLLDVMSLWLCSACPASGEQVLKPPVSYRVGEGQPLETQFRWEPFKVCMHPWRFDVPDLQIEATGWVVPQQKYGDPGELLAVRQTYGLEWCLVAS